MTPIRSYNIVKGTILQPDQRLISTLRSVLTGWLIILGLIGCNNDSTNNTLVALPDLVTTARGIPVTIVVLGNDSDTNGNSLQVVEVTQAMNGTVTLNDDDTVTYLPISDFVGEDSFFYTLGNDQDHVARAAATVSVLPEDGIVLHGILYTLTHIRFEVPHEPIVITGLGINDRGQIVGWYSGIDPLSYLFDNGTVTRLPVGASSIASDINNNSDIVGSFSDHSCNGLPIIARGFLLTDDGSFTPIDFPGINSPPPPICEQNFTYANGINDAGQMAGTFSDIDGIHGFFMDGGTFNQIDVPGTTETRANGINDAGQIAGTFTDVDGPHGFLIDGGTFSLFTIPGAARTFANGINNLGQIVGSMQIRQEPPQTGFFTRGYVATPIEQGPFVIFDGQ